MNFKKGDKVVYPSRGLGEVIDVTKQVFGDQELEFIVVNFEKFRMNLRIPLNKIEISGLRKISSKDEIAETLDVIKQTPKMKRMMWSKKAQEYEGKINSGDPKEVAEVVRNLHAKNNSENQSYSERRIYEEALERLADEYAAVYGMPIEETMEKLETIMDDAEFSRGGKKKTKMTDEQNEAMADEFKDLADDIDKLDI